MRKILFFSLLLALQCPLSFAATRTISNAGGNWNAVGAWTEGAVPLASDDVVATALSGNLVVTASSVCRSFNLALYTKTISGSGTWSVGDGTVGNFNLTGGVGEAWTNTSTITFKSTTGTNNITTNGFTLNAVVFNGVGGTWQLQDNMTLSSTTSPFTYTAGTLDTNSKVITCSGAGAAFVGGGQTYFELDLTGSGTPGITGTNTFTNLIRTSTAAKTDALSLSADQTVSGNLTFNGNSQSNRLLVRSNASPGTPRTITNTGATVGGQYVDFEDIVLTTSTNLSAITGGSGNCLGNSGITFTTSATQTWSGTVSGNWSTNAWTSRVPLPQDDIVISSAFSASQTVTMDMPRFGRDITWVGSTGSPTWDFSTTPGAVLFGGITLIPGMSISGTQGISFKNRDSRTLTNATRTWTNSIGLQMTGGTLVMADNFITNGSLTLTTGTLDCSTNNPSMQMTFLSSSNSNTRALSMGNNTWTQTATTGWLLTTSSGMTLTPNASTILYTDTSNTNTTFAGGSLTYANVYFSRGTSTATITLTGTNTFTDFKDDGTGTHTITFPNVTTTVSSFTVSGIVSHLITLQRTGASGTWTISDSSGSNNRDYLSISNSAATGGATWCAGANSTDGGGNTGWTFAACGAPAVNKTNFLMVNN